MRQIQRRSSGRTGVAVTVVEVLPQILPVEDAEIAANALVQADLRGVAEPRLDGDHVVLRRRWRLSND